MKVWFQNRRTKNRRTVDEGRPVQLEPDHTPSESSDDSFADSASQDTSCATTTNTATTTTTTTTTARLFSDSARLGRDVDSRRHVTAMMSHDEDEDNVYIGNHGNRAAATGGGAGVSGWSALYHSQTLQHGLSACPAAVTIGQS